MYELLVAEGHRVFLACQSLVPGDVLDRSISDAMNHTRIVAVIIDQSFDRSFYQRAELVQALDLSRSRPSELRLVPVYLPSSSPDAVPFGLSKIHGIHVGEDGGMAEVATALSKALERI